MTIAIDLTNGITREQCNSLIDELTYQCYKYNRNHNPDIEPKQWKLIFNNVDAIEQRYQRELINEKIRLN